MTSIAEDRARGVAVSTQPWPGGAAGDKLTLTEMARRIRDGMRTPSIRAMTGNILKSAGSPEGARARVEALRAHVRTTTMYAPDPPMTEMIQSAALTLCSEGSGALCIPIGDCDDLTVALGSLIGAAGIDVRVIALDYGPGIQPHVLLEFQDDSGKWLTVDPSPPHPPIGHRTPGAKVTVVDPHNPQIQGSSPKGQFVGVGAAPPTAIAYQNVPLASAVAHTGLRYRLGMQLTFSYDPTDNFRAKTETRAYFQQKGWVIETLEPQGPAQLVPGLNQYIQSWLLQGIATIEIPLTNDDIVQYLVVGVQSSSTTPATPDAAIVPAPSTGPAPWNASMSAALVTAVGVGAIAGVGWYFWKQHRLAEGY